MARTHYQTGLGEMWRSWSRRAFADALRKLVPEVREEDLVPAGAGVRAQAVDRSGALIDDFRITEGDRIVHVLNAPSPAATASLAIADEIAARVRANVRS
jgi:L-2-hydroxyglutarate oxidase